MNEKDMPGFLCYAACKKNDCGKYTGEIRWQRGNGCRTGYGGLCYSIARLAKPRK